MGVLGGLGGGAIGDWVDRNIFHGSGGTGKAIGSALGGFLFPFENGGVVRPVKYEMVGGIPAPVYPMTPLNRGLIGMPNPYAKTVMAEAGMMVHKKKTHRKKAHKKPAKK